jgi:hypothetical protein
MGFLLCLDPLLNRRARTYQEQRNEELSMVISFIKISQNSQSISSRLYH